jgi:hypothetical protein
LPEEFRVNRVKDLILMRLGKDKHAILLAIFLVFAASVRGQTEKSFKFHLKDTLQNNDVIIAENSIIVNYSISELNITNVKNDQGSFYRLSIPGHGRSSDPGKPELPVFSRLISIPEGSGFRINISNVKSTIIKPSGKKIEGILLPAQESETKAIQRTKPQFKQDKRIYASRDFIPGDTVKIESLGVSRNSKLANLYISPVRYNPHANQLEIITSMRIEITFTNSLSISKGAISTDRALFNESLDKGLLNFNPHDVIPGYSDQAVKMVIITDTSFRKLLKPFIKWKTQKGFRVKVLYKGNRYAGNDFSQLKDTLTKIYKAGSAADPPPEYLLIIGDVNKIPYFGVPGNGNITDMYYGEFDGNGDYIPEMFVGRLPVSDTTQLKTVLSKIIQYEKFDFVALNKFYSRAIASAGYDVGYSSYMNGQLKYAFTNYLTQSNGIEGFRFNYPESQASKDSILKIINQGASFINYTGHGDESGWLHVDIKTEDIALLNNKNMYPFVISNACRTAQFNLATGFGTEMVTTSDKGAIGFIGCSNDSYWDEDYTWAVGPGEISGDPTYAGTGLGAYDRLFHTHGESPSDWYFSMGQINFAGNLAVSASTSTRKKYYWETYNLIGDPSVIPILGKPGAFNVSLPDTLPNGIKSMTINVDPFAYVAVSHFDTLWDASFASSSGTAELKMPGLSNDSCLVVVTGQNKVPVIKRIYFSNINKEYVNLTSTGINDATGNNNGLADFGESVFLKLTLNNLGLTGAHNLYAKISSASDLLSITNDSVMIGDLASKSEAVISDKLSITISDKIPDLSTATIKLILKDQFTTKQYSIDICMHAPDLKIVSCTLDDKTDGNGNNTPDPGETFRLIFRVRNEGSSNIEGQFNIPTTHGDISIIEQNIKSGTLKFGQTTDIPVQVKLSATAAIGSLISLTSELNCNSYTTDKDFSFKVGKIRESFEASSFNVFPWINISAIPWVITSGDSYDGNISAKSGAISNNGSTSLILKANYSQNDSVKFYYRVSSEPNCDFFSLKLNGKEVLKKSGEVPWTMKSVAVSPGLNIFEWMYKKDNTVDQGSDCAWIDMIDFAQSGSVNYVQKDLQVARIMTPFRKDRFGQGLISAKIMNVGKDTLNGFNLAYKINNSSYPVEQYFKNKIAPFSDSVQVFFNTKADFSRLGMYDLVMYGFNNNDQNPLNDTLRAKIENTEISDSLIIYPNPFKDQFIVYINSMKADKIQISITNIAGVKLYNVTKDIVQGKNSITISDFKSAPAVYYLNVRGSVVNQTIRIINTSN